jgi:hypothetical protein
MQIFCLTKFPFFLKKRKIKKMNILKIISFSYQTQENALLFLNKKMYDK